MLSFNVRISNEPTILYALPSVDGTTQKRIEFVIMRSDNGWLYSHTITDGSRTLDQQMAMLLANGSIIVYAKEFAGDEPSSEWKDQVVRSALFAAGELSFD